MREDLHDLSHAYLICDAPEPGAERAGQLAAAMLCTAPGKRPCGVCRDCRKALRGIHPDIIVTERSSDDKGRLRQEITVDQVREIIASAPFLPNEAAHKVYIIKDAGRMNPSAQNALLKVLEEPPAHVSLILIAESAKQMLETVRSRCVTLTAAAAQDTVLSSECLSRCDTYLRLAAKRDALALYRGLFELETLDSTAAQEFFDGISVRLADVLAGRIPNPGLTVPELLALSDLAARAQAYQRQHVGLKHTLGMLAANTIP